MRKELTIIMTAAACVLTAYLFWNLETVSDDEDEHHDHDHHHEEMVHMSDDQMKEYGVVIQTAASGKLRQVIHAPAKIMIGADHIAHIYPKVTGTVLKAYKNLGESVAANEILATIGSREMAEAKAAYLAAYNRSLLAENTLEREKGLHEKRISAAQDYHRAESSREESLIDLELTKQKLHALGISEQDINQLPQEPLKNLMVYEMRSPIAGKVIERHVTQGELLSLDRETYTIADLNKLWVEMSIFPNERQYVKEGQVVTVSTHDGQTTKATIVYLSPVINEETRTSTAIAEIDNRLGKWFSGTYVNAELVTDVIQVPLMAPKEAVQNIDGQDAVFISMADGFLVRPVKLGRSDDHYCEIVSGIEPGENYACKNTFLLKAELKKDEAEHMD